MWLACVLHSNNGKVNTESEDKNTFYKSVSPIFDNHNCVIGEIMNPVTVHTLSLEKSN